MLRPWTAQFDDLLQYNDGLKTKLIGTAEQVAERIVFLKSLGASIILCAFLHYEDDIEAFGKTVLPLVRKLEAEGRGKSEEHEVGISGDIYRARITGEKTVVQILNVSGRNLNDDQVSVIMTL